jgi:hypothetical protein
MSVVAIEKESQMALKSVIIFDNPALVARATAVLEKAASNADETIKWDIKSWQVDALKRPDFVGVTVAVAVDADLIVLALDKMHNASDELLDWLEHWSEHRQIEDAAIMAFCPENSRPAFFNELKCFTEWRGLNFLENHDANAPQNLIRIGHLIPRVQSMAKEPVLAAIEE